MINLERISNRDAVSASSNSSGNKSHKPSLVIGEILPNEAWIKIARELIYFGEYYKARVL